MIPKYLYHYTSIDSLKKIIENKTIRFTRLDKTNDPYEGYCVIDGNDEIYKSLSSRVYVSCWTSENRESIPMWYIYSSMKGVRIKIKSNMFSDNLNIEELVDKFIPAQKLNSDIFLDDTRIKNVHGPLKVDYIDDSKKMHKNVNIKSVEKTSSGDCTFNNFKFYELGYEKLSQWSYENEYRFRISPYLGINANEKIFCDISYMPVNLPEHIDLPICKEIEEIIVGEKVTKAEYKNLLIFLESQGYHGYIKLSEIKTRL